MQRVNISRSIDCRRALRVHTVLEIPLACQFHAARQLPAFDAVVAESLTYKIMFPGNGAPVMGQ
jgi:hypothetical protein